VGRVRASFIEALAIVLFVSFVGWAGAPASGSHVGAAMLAIVFIIITRCRSICIVLRSAR